MPRPSDLFALAALGVLTSCHCASPTADTLKAVSTSSSPSHALPTATEEFRFRGECVRLGKKKLAATEEELYPTERYSNWTYSFSEEAHYDPRSNRCFVEIDNHESDKARPLFEEFDRDLYDGQTDDLLAFTQNRPQKDGIAEMHNAMVFTDHGYKGVPHGTGNGELQGDAWIKADSEAMYEDTQQYISGLMNEIPRNRKGRGRRIP